MTYSLRKFLRAGACTVALFALTALTAAIPALAQTPPVIDGNINDLIQYANFVQQSGNGCGVIINDPQGDIVVADPNVIPCDPAFVQGVSTYFVNGFDQTTGVVTYVGTTLYLGIRVVGVIGDPDGNGDPNTSCPQSTIQDGAGIEQAATYEWRFDTNCDGIFETIVTVSNNTVNLTGLTGVGTFAFNGHDIEVQVTGTNILPLFQVRTFSGHREDGLGEDLSPVGQCAPPELNISVVKTVNPATICPGANTTVTLQVCNPSQFAQTGITLTDVMPAGFTYVPGSVTGIGAPVGSGTLAFPVFSLDPAQCRTVTFQITSPQNCFGQVENVANVSGTFASPCLPPPGTIGTTATSTAIITCQPVPVCNITGPTVVCTGSTGNVFNISSTVAGSTFSTVVSGNGTIVGSSTGNSVTVTAGAAGTFTLTTTVVANGCSSTCVYPVTVNPLPTCAFTGPTAACAGATGLVFNLTSNVAGATFSTVISGNGTIIGSPTGSTITVNAGAAGSFTLTTTVVAAGCTATCTRTVTVNPAPTCTITGPTAVCAGATGNTFNVTSNVAGATFSTVVSGNGTIIGSSTGSTITVNAGAAGTFLLTTTVTANGCSSTCTYPVTVNPLPTCTIAGPTSVCTGSTGNTFTITGPAGATFSTVISGNGTIIGSATGSTINVTAGATGTFTLTTTVTLNGCVSTCTYPVTVTPAPTCTITGPQSVCTGSTGNMFTVTGPAGATFSWLISGNGTIIGSTTGGTVNVTAGAAGTFLLTATVNLNGCVSTCTYPVTVTPAPTCTITGPRSVCTGSTGNTFTVTGPAGATFSWVISGNGTIIGSATGASVNITAGASGSFTLTATVNLNGCVSTCTYPVTVTPAPTCTITGPQAICSGSTNNTYTVTGPAGATFGWVITGNGTVIGSSVGPSINVTAGAAGTFTLTATVNLNGCTSTCTYLVTVNALPTCTITGPDTVCAGSTNNVFTVTSNVAGATFSTVISGNATIVGSTTGGTINVTGGAIGQFTLVTTVVANGCTSTCRLVRDVTQCIVNCPRTVGFWSQQCIQRNGGSTKFTVSQMDQITACIDQHSTFFNWSNDFGSFCSLINPSMPMTSQKQALRQYAGLLANVCAGELMLTASNGDVVTLDPNTPISCAGFPTVTTVGELIAAFDAALAGPNPNYNAIISCADAINNGIGIGETCNEESASTTPSSSGTDMVTLNQANPNPFHNTTRIAYAVDGAQALNVSVDVYDISGRLVRKLAGGSMNPGRYEVEWDGRTDSGDTVAGGVYFVRIMTGNTKATSRILFMK